MSFNKVVVLQESFIFTVWSLSFDQNVNIFSNPQGIDSSLVAYFKLYFPYGTEPP